MKNKYFFYGSDGMLLSTAFLDDDDAYAQVNITRIEPVACAGGAAPYFVNGLWECRPLPAPPPAAREYPDIKEQMDMIWHAMDSGEIPVASVFYEAIKAVKDATPSSRAPFEVGPMVSA